MATRTNTQTGHCLCEKVKFEAQGVDPHLHACHCSICRNWTGSPMLAAASEKVTFTGESHIKRYASSEWAERGFCENCGTSLFYYLKPADQYIMCTGTFDDQSIFELAGEIFIDQKPPGYAFAGDHERLTGEEFMRQHSAE